MAEDILGEFKFEGYKQPSAYSMGKGAFETAVKSVGFDDLGAFNKYLADRGIGRVGKDPKGTLELNRLRIEAGLEPYRKIPLVQAAAEKEAFGEDTKKTRPQRAGRMNVGFKAISDAAEKIDGDENKLRFIIDQITERFPQLAKATVINLARTIFMGAGPSLLGADFMSSEATEQMRDVLFGPQEQMSFAEGGIANIKSMIRPLTFDVGGMAAEDEGKTFGRGEFSYDDPKLIKFIQKKADQNNTTYQEELIKFVDEVESFYRNKKAEGGIMTSTPVGYKMGTRKGDLVGDKEKGIATIKIGLMEDTGDLNILGMKLILQEAADTLEEMDKIEKMNSKEIIKMFENFMGKQGT